MAVVARDQALSLLAAAKNHGDVMVKISSLRKVRDILLSVDPSFAFEVFPYLAELQSSRESLVRKSLIEVIEDIGLRAMEHSYVLVAALLYLLRDEDPQVAKQSVITGTNIFCSFVEEIALQFLSRGKVERWAGEFWGLMVKFKDAMCASALEPGSVETKVLVLKFLEKFILLFTSDTSDSDELVNGGNRRMFNISWIAGGHPILHPTILMSEANRTFGILLDLLRLANSLPGALTITVVNWS